MHQQQASSKLLFWHSDLVLGSPKHTSCPVKVSLFRKCVHYQLQVQIGLDLGAAAAKEWRSAYLCAHLLNWLACLFSSVVCHSLC